MTQLLNTNDRKLLMKVAKFVHLGMKEYTSLLDVVSENIDSADLTEYLIMTVNRYIPCILVTYIIFFLMILYFLYVPQKVVRE